MERRKAADLLVEHAVPLVDVCNVAFVFVEAFAGELVAFVLTIRRRGTEGSQQRIPGRQRTEGRKEGHRRGSDGERLRGSPPSTTNVGI